MLSIREERPTDIPAREALLDACFGDERFEKTCERLREGRLPAEGLSLVVEADGAVVGTVRLWRVTAGPDRPALMLGPIAVDPAYQGFGIGSKLVGDAPYYERFGFSTEPAALLWLPGPFERRRFLGLELTSGALAGACGLVAATGAFETPTSGLAASRPGAARFHYAG